MSLWWLGSQQVQFLSFPEGLTLVRVSDRQHLQQSAQEGLRWARRSCCPTGNLDQGLQTFGLRISTHSQTKELPKSFAFLYHGVQIPELSLGATSPAF